jgi:hypothetical protein
MNPDEFMAAVQALQLRAWEARAREADADADRAELKRERQRLLTENVRAAVEGGRCGHN